MIQALGLKIVIWNRDTYDWTFTNFVPNATSVALASTKPPLVDGEYSPVVPQQIPLLFKEWLNFTQESSSAISLQHDLYKVSTQEIAPSLDVLTRSKFKLTDITQCVSILKPYANDLLIKAKMPLDFLNPPPPHLTNASGSDPNPPGYYTFSSSTRLSPVLLWVLLVFLK